MKLCHWTFFFCLLLLVLPCRCVWCEPLRVRSAGPGGRGWRASAVAPPARSWALGLWATAWWTAGGWTSWSQGVILHPAQSKERMIRYSADSCYKTVLTQCFLLYSYMSFVFLPWVFLFFFFTIFLFCMKK